MATFSDIVNLWPSAVAMAADLGLPPEKGAIRTRAWRNRDFIPPEMWPAVIKAAETRGFKDVTADLLMRLAVERKTAA